MKYKKMKWKYNVKKIKIKNAEKIQTNLYHDPYLNK